MTQPEISKLLNMPFPKLAKACRDPETLATVVSLCYQSGIALGREQTHKYYNQMFKGYNEVSINN